MSFQRMFRTCFLAATLLTSLGLTVLADRDVDNFGPCSDVSGMPYCTIQAAINDAAAGETVTVAVGTYDGSNLVLNKSLRLNGAQSGNDACDRAGGETIITAGAGTLLTLMTGSAGSVIDGFTFDGGTRGIESSSGPINGVQILNNRFINFTGSGIFLNDNGVDITIDQNLVDGQSAGAGGIIHLDADGFDGMHITNNCVSNGATGLFSDGNRNVGESVLRKPLLKGNLFDNNGTGVNLGRKSFEFAEISHNVFSNNDFDGLQGGPADSEISQNSFIGNGRRGLSLTGFGGTLDGTRGAQRNTITQNCFSGNGFLEAAGGAILFSSTQAAGTISTNQVHDNNIYDNAAGASYGGSEGIDALNNWWGAADGPSGDGSGSGDSVNGMSILFDPFLPIRAEGTPCTDQLPLPVDHYLMYQIKESHEAEKFEKIDVHLVDQFQAGIFTVEKPVELLNPASKNDEPVFQPEVHLQSYKVKGPKLDHKIRNVTIQNQFGVLLVDVDEHAQRLFVPAGKHIPPQPDPLPPVSTVDHYLCYDVKESKHSPKFDKTIVKIVDQFTGPGGKFFEVERPRRLCNPADKNGEGVNDPDTHLACYDVKLDKGEARHEKTDSIQLVDQFGARLVQTLKERELCLPSTKTLPIP